ncbi:hypothetical protein EBU99_11620 [bacterium]|nr:hypothetical protein [bacterium]
MKSRILIALAVLAAALIPACVSSRQAEPQLQGNGAINGAELYGSIENDSESYPWLSPKHDKGIYASSAQTSPFRDNTLTYSNLHSRIQKTSKKK